MGIACAEVADQEVWNCATIGLTCVSNQAAHAQSIVQHAINAFDDLTTAEVEGVESETIRFGEE